MNTNTNTILLFFLSIILLGFSSCARYEGKRLQAPHAPIYEKENIEVAQKALTERECRHYFGGRKLLARGYQPVQIYIKNNTNKILYLDPNHITLPLVPASSVARKMNRNVGWKITKYFIIGGPIWGAIEGFASYDANKVIKSDIAEKSVRLDKAIPIRPHGIINKIMFIARENYLSNFNISLIDPKLKRKIDFKF